ncbi:class I SAM-dependent methyltransferase [Dyella telluris]|uniref:Class I SAM-dependent methyltransferase n=1 Tax=Dyella telluris TaxID=2763498 RepID=A0A7G8Q1X3_9GAMM|nr:class I SAM-dependent methyltransferase [Dyella telluris]QNK00781.1 class I SAM-dependent methyltransferase [Dyella telluris]
MTDFKSTERFSDRVVEYVRYRPDYPVAMLHWLQDTFAVTPQWQVADIGAGTGISSKLFLDGGYRVTAVEPNAPMREAAESWLGDNPRFRAVDGQATGTGLDSGSIDLVIAAQAFHWFDQDAARREFARILRPDGLAAIIWNSRRLLGTPFLEGYEALLKQYGTDYTSVAERYGDEPGMRAWFGSGYRAMGRFDHGQRLDYDGVAGRLLSSSYAPREGHPQHEPMMRALRDLFDRTAVDGRISFDYDTVIFVGTLT